MADAWGGSWGSSWGVSWGAGVTPPTPAQTGGDGVSGGRQRRRARRREGYRQRLLALQAEQLVAVEAAPKEAVRRTIPRQVIREASAVLPKWMGWTEPAIEAALPRAVYIPAPLVRNFDADLVTAVLAYLKQLADEEEDDIEMLLLSL